jgi:hypothetical protein
MGGWIVTSIGILFLIFGIYSILEIKKKEKHG